MMNELVWWSRLLLTLHILNFIIKLLFVIILDISSQVMGYESIEMHCWLLGLCVLIA